MLSNVLKLHGGIAVPWKNNNGAEVIKEEYKIIQEMKSRDYQNVKQYFIQKNYTQIQKKNHFSNIECKFMLIENLKRSNNIKKIKNFMIKENSTLNENTKIIFWKERRY